MGGFAGIVAALVKYISHDHAHILQLIEMEQQSKIPQLMVGYLGGAAVLFTLGAVAVWWSSEIESIRKMFAIGLSAPALLAAAVPPTGQLPTILPEPKKAGWLIEQVMPSAYAQQSNWTPDCIGDSAFLKGFKLFWGQRENTVGYRVVVGSFLSPADAAAKAKAINAEDPSMNAKVGPRRCDNDYYPVVVGNVTSLEDAKKQATKANNLNSISDVFVSPVPAY
jgi:hypothetical protein